MSGISKGLARAIGVLGGFAVFIGAGVTADGRPPRVERRMARAQAVLDRESARAQGRERPIGQTPPSRPGPAATVVPGKAGAPALAPVPTQPPREVTGSGVNAAAFESPVRPTPSPASPAATRPGEPAEDGTYSVLVRPDAGTADQPAEPLRLPDATTP